MKFSPAATLRQCTRKNRVRRLGHAGQLQLVVQLTAHGECARHFRGVRARRAPGTKRRASTSTPTFRPGKSSAPTTSASAVSSSPASSTCQQQGLRDPFLQRFGRLGNVNAINGAACSALGRQSPKMGCSAMSRNYGNHPRLHQRRCRRCPSPAVPLPFRSPT